MVLRKRNWSKEGNSLSKVNRVSALRRDDGLVERRIYWMLIGWMVGVLPEGASGSCAPSGTLLAVAALRKRRVPRYLGRSETAAVVAVVLLPTLPRLLMCS
jgi:hypothetical protein